MANIFFIGIKGAGMSALANILKDLGNEVSGSDIEEHVFTQKALIENDITIVPFSVENMNQSYDIIIKGNAFNSENNIEVAHLVKENIEHISYYEFLADFLANYISVGISGTHGKTTTTGLLAQVFSDKKVASLIGDGTGIAAKNAEYFLFEACEYKRHFLYYAPTYLIITNIEFDHPDYFEDVEDVIDAFASAAQKTKKAVVAFGDDEHVRTMMQDVEAVPVITFGFESDNTYTIIDYTPTSEGISFSLEKNGENIGTFNLPFYGKHMLINAVSTLVIADLEGMDLQQAEKKLQQFSGVKRRFNIEEINVYTIIDDYAHHPTEIRATLDAARQQFPTKEIVSIFQPHTFSRTNALAADFAEALKKSDVVYITDIFASAREQSKDVVPTILLDKLPEAKRLEMTTITQLAAHENSLIIFMGAGNIQDYLEKAKKTFEK